jgi:hypothetical protein
MSVSSRIGKGLVDTEDVDLTEISAEFLDSRNLMQPAAVLLKHQNLLQRLFSSYGAFGI